MFNDNLFYGCLKIIENWKPNKLLSELQYRDTLRKLLFDKLNENYGEQINVRIEASRSLCDIAIGREVGIELKF